MASLVLYAAARLAAFKLFVPSRYLEYATNIFLVLGAAVALEALLRLRLARSPAAVAALLACALILGAWRQRGVELYDFSGDSALYAFAKTTPKEARFAGPPELMDNVLTFGERNVYVSFELAHPWSEGYWKTVGRRLELLADAAYASDPEALRRFCVDEGIDYFVVDRTQYQPEAIARGVCFEPFGTRIREKAAASEGFAALSGAFPAVQVSDKLSVLDMRTMRRGAPGTEARR